jgi:hypothetical protein
MIYRYLIFAFLLMSTISFAQKSHKLEATIYFNNSTSEKGILKIKENNSKAKKLSFIKNSDRKKKRIVLTDIKKIIVHSRKLQLLNSEIDIILEPVYIEKKKNPILLYLVLEGNLSLYVDRLVNSSSGIHGSVFGVVTTYDTYYIKSNDNSKATKIYSETSPSFKNNVLDYFENNKIIFSEIMVYGRNFNSSKLYNILKKYNLQNE